MTNVYTVFSAAKHNIASDFPQHMSQTRLARTHHAVVNPNVMASDLYGDNYRSTVRIPGYYNPNNHTIYLNKKTLPTLSEQTAYIICYHELVHSISAHRVKKTADYQLFQSGLKRETFQGGRYRCLHRLFNEGIVQYLTTYYAGVSSDNYAYAREVALVELLVADLGHDLIKNTLLDGNCENLQAHFDAHYGTGSFTRFSTLLDKKAYERAEKIITKK
jgi:hypothetical protein